MVHIDPERLPLSQDIFDGLNIKLMKNHVFTPQLHDDVLERRLARAVSAFSAETALRRQLEASDFVVSPEVAASSVATEVFWRQLADEFGLLSSLQVAATLGARAHRSYASDLRKAGKAVGVERLNKVLYPGFQFSEGQVRPVMERLIATARRLDRPEKSIVYWLCSPTTYIQGGGRPVDHLDDTELVSMAAEQAWSVDW